MRSETNRFLIYRSEDSRTRIDVMLEAETWWLNPKQLNISDDELLSSKVKKK